MIDRFARTLGVFRGAAVLRPFATLRHGSALQQPSIVSSIEFDRPGLFCATAGVEILCVFLAFIAATNPFPLVFSGVTRRIKVYDYEAVVGNVRLCLLACLLCVFFALAP